MSEKYALLPTQRIFCNQNSLWRCANARYHETGYVQPKWLTEPKIMSLSQPGPHIEW